MVSKRASVGSEKRKNLTTLVALRLILLIHFAVVLLVLDKVISASRHPATPLDGVIPIDAILGCFGDLRFSSV